MGAITDPRGGGVLVRLNKAKKELIWCQIDLIIGDEEGLRRSTWRGRNAMHGQLVTEGLEDIISDWNIRIHIFSFDRIYIL